MDKYSANLFEEKKKDLERKDKNGRERLNCLYKL